MKVVHVMSPRGKPKMRSTKLVEASGFSLIELLVVLGIIAILGAIAVPGFQSLIASTRIKTTTNDIIATLAQVRSLAIKEGGRVTMCKSSNGTQCATTGDWNQGWIIFIDPIKSSPWTYANVDTDEVVISYSQSSVGDIVIKGNSTVRQYVSYSADGLSRQLNGGFLAGTIRVCSTSAAIKNFDRARDITINSVGRVITTKVTVSSACDSPA